MQVPYIENGVTKVKTVMQTQFRVEERIATVQLANSRVITPDGKQLPIEDVWKRLKAKAVIAYSDAGTPGEQYLRALNPETLVIIGPMPPIPPAPPPPPPKMP